MNFIQIFQISNEFDGVAPINTITLKENIIQIGSFMNDLIVLRIQFALWFLHH